jgi:hypothetical protein
VVEDESSRNIMPDLDKVPQQMGRVHYGKKRLNQQKGKPDSNSAVELTHKNLLSGRLMSSMTATLISKGNFPGNLRTSH